MLLSSKRVLPGFTLSLGSSLLFVCLVLLLSLSALVMQLSQMTLAQYWDVIINGQVVAAYKVTLLAAGVASIFNCFFGMLMAWILTRYEFPGKSLVDGLMDLPFALPTAVAGLTLAGLFSTTGFYGQWLAHFDIKVAYTWLGIAVAMAFTSIPFVIRELVPVMLSQGSHEDEAVVLLGASGWQMFRRVTLPNIRWALLYGVVLTNARAIGEFGAVSVVSGSIRGETYTLPLQVELLHQDYNTAGAFTAAALLTLMAIVTLFLKSGLQWRLKRHNDRLEREESHEH